METALQRVPLLQIKSGAATRQQHIKAIDKGIEVYTCDETLLHSNLPALSPLLDVNR